MAMPLTVHRFTVEEYHRMGEAGVFHEDARVELIDGQVVEMTLIGPDHASCVNRLVEMFAPLAGKVTLSPQNPVVVAEYQEPQPDVTVLKHRADGYRSRRPVAADVLLVIEVGDSSADRDRKRKVPVYAQAGIPECWLVDLPADRIQIYRHPSGGSYAEVATAARGATLTPLLLPDLQLSADRILG